MDYGMFQSVYLITYEYFPKSLHILLFFYIKDFGKQIIPPPEILGNSILAGNSILFLLKKPFC